MKEKKTMVVNICFQKHDSYIGRGSKWGNPFIIGKDGNREEVIEKYEKYIRNKPELLKDLIELKGSRLGCFCWPNHCHGHVLIELIEEMEQDKDD